jgi:uncharacterized caspase-like protein
MRRRGGFLRRLGLLVLIGATAGAASARAAERVALVIGNSAYQHLPRLANPENDARLIAATLQSVGFQLIGGKAQTDLDRAGLERAIRQFGTELAGGAVGLFYYAGHGVQVKGANYLVPVGANPTSTADVDFELIDAELVLKQMEAASSKLNFVILDACRNNPLGGRGLRDTGGGLAQMKAPTGTLISYATQPGNVALDGTAGHSPYTAALVATMKKPGLRVLDVFNEVGLAVDKSTGGRQQPWQSSSPIDGNFYFLGPTTIDITPSAAGLQPEQETVFWKSIAQSTNAADFEEYLRKYPKGQFSGLAHNRVAASRPPPSSSPQSALSPSESYRRAQEAWKRGDTKTALKWQQEAADQGHIRAAAELGALYYSGCDSCGAPRDLRAAVPWILTAAEKGDPEAIRLRASLPSLRPVPLNESTPDARLHAAIKSKDPAGVEKAISEGTNPNILSDAGECPIRISASMGGPISRQITASLLKAGADVKCTYNGVPVLSFVSDWQIAQMLITASSIPSFFQT